ncbi:MAG: flavodoxin domain-containing protein [Bacteroidales bacterium]|nr:flavodoxin domain-containing protein [Bacteroidales bacterium]
MKKIGIYYWPLKGNVEKTAKTLASKLTEYDVTLITLEEATIESFDNFDFLIFGNSTVGAPHWEHATTDNKWFLMFHQLEEKNIDFNGKKTAFFSLGDQVNYPHNFVDSLELVHSYLEKLHIQTVGNWPNKGYEFYESKALRGDNFIGLVLDLDNQPDSLDSYTSQWVEILRQEFV